MNDTTGDMVVNIALGMVWGFIIGMLIFSTL